MAAYVGRFGAYELRRVQQRIIGQMTLEVCHRRWKALEEEGANKYGAVWDGWASGRVTRPYGCSWVNAL